jgi:hypothetical protein
MSVVPRQDRLAGAWNFSAIHSAVTFSVAYVVASFRASFEEVAATLVDGKLSGAARPHRLRRQLERRPAERRPRAVRRRRADRRARVHPGRLSR